MARRKVEEKNYPELIEMAEERIEALSAELKQEKANLKQLKKDQVRYDAMVEKQRKQAEVQKAAELHLERAWKKSKNFLQTNSQTKLKKNCRRHIFAALTYQ